MSRKGQNKHNTWKFAITDLVEETANVLKDVILFLTGQRKPEDLLGVIEKLEKDNAEKDVKITTIEKQNCDLEQYLCMDNVFVSGLKVNQHRIREQLRSQIRSILTKVAQVTTQCISLQVNLIKYRKMALQFAIQLKQ